MHVLLSLEVTLQHVLFTLSREIFSCMYTNGGREGTHFVSKDTQIK